MRGPHCRRRSAPLLLAAVALWAGLAADVAAQGSAATDRAALEALYDATGGPGWTDSTNWNTSAPIGEWFGVSTDAAGRVTWLSLWGNELTGPVPAELGNLVNLEWLSLSGNDLTGPIPAELGSLVNLESLELGGNALTGPIPAELGSLVNLEWLSLSGNDLTGPIPAELGSLVNLGSLDLGWNDLAGPIPSELGLLVNLEWLFLGWNDLAGPIPAELGRLTNLRELDLFANDLTGPIPDELGNLVNIERLGLSYNWGLSGPLPSGLETAPLEALDIFVTRTCAPAAWKAWLETIDFAGSSCGVEPDVTIDVAVFYTLGAREDAGGTDAIEAEIDLLIAMANEAYAVSGVRHRMVLVGRAEVPYTESGDAFTDFDRFSDPSDGHMDEVHAMRTRTGADLAHLLVRPLADDRIGGLANLGGPFGLTDMCCPNVFVHETGHNLGLSHDRYTSHGEERGAAHPAYGYVNQRALESGAPPSSRWSTIMSESNQCLDFGRFACPWLPRFSNPRQSYNGDPLGVAYGEGSGVTGPADAAAVLNATGPAVALWRNRPAGANRPPAASGTLPDRALTLPGTLTVDVSPAFVDPDGDRLTYAVSSSAPDVVTVLAAGARVTLTAVGVGRATIEVTATDPGGLSATQAFTVTVVVTVTGGFTDDPIVAGVTPVRAVHFTELRAHIDALREEAGLGLFRWTDPVLRAGMTPVRLVHLLELREALGAAYTAAGRAEPRCSLFGCGRQAARPLGHQALPVRRDDLGPRNPASPRPDQTLLRARFQCPTQAAGPRSAAP